MIRRLSLVLVSTDIIIKWNIQISTLIFIINKFQSMDYLALLRCVYFLDEWLSGFGWYALWWFVAYTYCIKRNEKVRLRLSNRREGQQ